MRYENTDLIDTMLVYNIFMKMQMSMTVWVDTTLKICFYTIFIHLMILFCGRISIFVRIKK